MRKIPSPSLFHNTLSYSIKGIVDAESRNTGFIQLYPEGLIFKAYERSAFLFHTQVSQVKALSRFVKSLDSMQLVSVSLQRSDLDRLKRDLEPVGENRFAAREPFSEEAFQSWKKSLLPHTKVQPTTLTVTRPQSPEYIELMDLIRNFPVESKTPIECMVFLSELKRTLNL